MNDADVLKDGNGWHNKQMDDLVDVWMACAPCFAFKWWPRSLFMEYCT